VNAEKIYLDFQNPSQFLKKLEPLAAMKPEQAS
jgi:hypothetical protein